MTTRKILHFTIGPVQDFIADARRLRDYWAGSFLLSLLSGHAMVAVKKAGGTIIFPKVAGDELFEAIRTKNRGADVYIGSLPNRFKADISNMSGSVESIAKKAVLDAWNAICEAVWEEYLVEAAASGNGTKGIWDRQTNNFWDIAWAAGDVLDGKDSGDGAWLDMRKNWRRLQPKLVEGGDHCRLMGQYQELSGYHRIGEKDRQEQFWEAVRSKVGGQVVSGRQSDQQDGTLNLVSDEYLCGLAFIKRVLPIYLKTKGSIDNAIWWTQGGAKLSTRNWPSTSYVAALPWLKTIQSDLDHHNLALDAYINVVEGLKANYRYGETETRLFNLPVERFFKLDGHLLYESGIQTWAGEAGLSEDEKVKLVTAYNDLVKALDLKKKRPTPFYAILRLDGDGVGALLGRYPDIIRKGLFDFTNRVKEYFDPDKGNPQHGALVYAGGDDVLAFLPVETAIKAACELRNQYREAFVWACKDKSVDPSIFTLSGSIVYSHFKNPLSAALRLSMEQLEEIAKDKNGRNSLALCISKPGGVAARWVNVFGDKPDKLSDTAMELESLSLNELSQEPDAGISSGFFHGFAAKYQKLVEGADESNALFVDENGAENALLEALIIAELKRQFSGKWRDNDRIGDVAASIGRILRPTIRKGSAEDGYRLGTAPGIAFDGGLIVRFLSQECQPPRNVGATNAGDNAS